MALAVLFVGTNAQGKYITGSKTSVEKIFWQPPEKKQKYFDKFFVHFLNILLVFETRAETLKKQIYFGGKYFEIV